MVLVNTSLKEQQQAASAGIQSVNGLGNKFQTEIFDDFKRETLNPTNAVARYTVANNGGGSGTLNGDSLRILTSSGGAGEDVDVRLSELGIVRTSPLDIRRSSVEIDISISPVTTSNVEMFVGIIDSTAALTALPTTTRHLGIKADLSASANWTFTSADGSSQSTSDSGISFSTTGRILRILWNGADSATLSLRNSPNTAENASTSVTSLGGNFNTVFQLHYFVQNEAAQAVDLRSGGYSIKYT